MRTDKFMMAKAWMKQDQAPQSEARDTWNMMEAEFNDERKAMLMANAESDKIKAMMNEKYGPGTIKYGSEIKQPEIKTPQAAFEFSQRNPAAEGGRMRFDEGLSAKQKKALTITYGKDATKDLEIKKSGFDDMNLKRRLDAYEKLEETYGKEFVEEEFKKKHGVSFRDIASKKEHNGKKVTNIIDGFKKKITGFYKSENTSPTYNEKTGHIYKKANKFGTVYSTEPATKPKAQNQKLIDDITADAPNMSQKELIEKYKINKNTLTTIRDENNLKFRQSYLPEGEQKKLIPYEDRFSAQEKSDMYIKRKTTETDADRANAKERKAKYRDKVYAEYKMEPASRGPYDDLWKDITRSSKDGERIKLVEGPKYSSGATYADFKTRVFLDTKTGETFNYNNLKNYLDSGKLEGITYDNVIEPYNLKNKIAASGLKEDIQKAYFGDKYQPPKNFRSQNTFHVHHIGGVGADPFSVQLTFADQNLGLVHNKTFNKQWAKLIEKNAPLSERKNYLKFVKSKIQDNIAQTLDFPEVGKNRTFGEIGTDMKKLLSNEKFKNIDDKELKQFIRSVGCPNGVLEAASGGNCLTKGTELINNGMKGATQASAKNFTKFANTALRYGKNIMKFGIIPEAIYVGAETAVRMGMGDSFSQASKQALGFYLDPILGTNFKKEGAFSKMESDVGTDMAFDVARLNEYKESLAKVESIKSNKENVLATNDESLSGQTDQAVAAQYDKFIAKAEAELNKRMLSETERIDFDNKADTAADVAGVKSPIRQFIGNARNNTELMRVEDDPTGMQSDMIAPEVTQKDLNKKMLPQKAMRPGLSKFVNFDDRQIDKLSGLTKQPANELRDYQEYLNDERNLSFADQARIFGKEQTYGTQGNFFGEKIKQTPMYDYAEGGITGLRSKYEYKK